MKQARNQADHEYLTLRAQIAAGLYSAVRHAGGDPVDHMRRVIDVAELLLRVNNAEGVPDSAHPRGPREVPAVKPKR